ncbi:hypothetical protein D3C72_1487340 [compost metagenome]
MAQIDRRQRHPGEAAVRMIDPSRHRHDPLAARTALDRRPDVRPSAWMIAMEQKILAVRIVEPVLPDTIGVGKPAPRFVEHKQTVELAQLTALGAEQTR